MSKIIILDKLKELINSSNSLPSYNPSNNQEYDKLCFRIDALLSNNQKFEKYTSIFRSLLFKDNLAQSNYDIASDGNVEETRYTKSVNDIKALLESLSEEVSEWENSPKDILLIKIKEFKSKLNLLIQKRWLQLLPELLYLLSFFVKIILVLDLPLD